MRFFIVGINNRMIDVDGLSGSLKSIIDDPVKPVFADKYTATRENSIATGTSGLVLALFELAHDGSAQVTSDGPIADIFSASLGGRKDRIVVSNSLKKSNSELEVLGDVFTGFACANWSRLVMRQKKRSNSFTEGPGSVVRPGLGHGELIREFTGWAISDMSTPFRSSEIDFTGFGWCNGLGGLLVAKATAGCIGGYLANLESEMSDVVFEILNLESSILWNMGPSLCHGLPGLLAICAGIARAIDNGEILKAIQERFELLVSTELEMSAPEDVYLDASWLTGSAGILWAYAAVRKKPHINPLLPFDSVVHAT